MVEKIEREQLFRNLVPQNLKNHKLLLNILQELAFYQGTGDVIPVIIDYCDAINKKDSEADPVKIIQMLYNRYGLEKKYGKLDYKKFNLARNGYIV